MLLTFATLKALIFGITLGRNYALSNFFIKFVAKVKIQRKRI